MASNVPFAGGGLKSKGFGADAFAGLAYIVLLSAVIAVMYFGRALLVPLALAVLITFMLSPMAARLERVLGRTVAIGGMAIVIFLVLGTAGWVVTRQALDLMARLPDYRANIEKKVQALALPADSPVKRFSQMVGDVESEIPGMAAGPGKAASGPAVRPPAPGAEHAPAAGAVDPLLQLRWLVSPFVGGLATTGVVVILVVFMLLKREDIRARFIRIVGHQRISATSRALEDAGERVSRYLLAQLVVNLAFGTAIALGLFLIGMPNAFLWGALAACLRFVPYVGVMLAALGPLVLALAVSPGWQLLVSTCSLFILLELIVANVVEPLFFKSSTGISSLALIVAAIFWAWLWGPIGLILSTPLTVCAVVLGKHVPRLSFLSVLLGNEEALSPSEDCYHRLLVGGMNEVAAVVEVHLKADTLTTLYGDVLIPTLTMAEQDFARQELDVEQRARVLQGVRDIIEDLASRPAAADRPGPLEAADLLANAPGNSDLRAACIPARAERDELASSIIAHLLDRRGLRVTLSEAGTPQAKVATWVEEQNLDVVCISAVAPTTAAHTRQLCAKVRARCPKLKILVALWGATDDPERTRQALAASGADEVVFTLADAVSRLMGYSTSVIGEMVPAPIPADEELRLKALKGLEAYGAKSDPTFDRMTRDLARTFDVPIALLTLVDRDRQLFKSQLGLPEEMAGVCEIPRESSVCAHAVAANAILVVEDLAADRRFANNPMLKKLKLRFYAGVPLRAPGGQPVGALCILDTKPRHFGDAERRILTIMGDVMSDEIGSHPVGSGSRPPLPATAGAVT